MKRIFTILSFALLFTSCTNSTKDKTNNSSNNASDSQNSDNKTINITSSETLITYFSVTNNTEKIANYIKDYLGSDIYKIEPVTPYSNDDINYSDSNSRATKEQNDNNCRPEIKNKVENISKYKTIVLGYPIWFGQAPKIIYSFIESYNLENYNIIPFCTSGSTGIDSSVNSLSKSAPKANWLKGKRFSSSSSKEDVTSWMSSYIRKEEKMKLLIDNKNIDVTWENNNSILDLEKLVPLTIKMNKYGGFEQTGNIGKTISSNDSNIDVKPGDIVLYNSNQISVFYNNHNWSYTYLGHINLETKDINSLLNKDSIEFKLTKE